jgi:CheY-like chemotaxis protein
MSGEKILIVEDNLTNLKLVEALLTYDAYEFKSVTNAEMALETLKTFKPDLILMDIQLPKIDGLQLTRMLRADPEFKKTIIIAVTSFAMKGDEDKALAAGCDDYVTKPIDPDKFLALIASYIRAAVPQPSS